MQLQGIINMKKFLVIIIGLSLLVYLAQVYEAQSCKDLVKNLNLTGTEAKAKYEECKKF
jgi:hypothetical protein